MFDLRTTTKPNASQAESLTPSGTSTTNSISSKQPPTFASTQFSPSVDISSIQADLSRHTVANSTSSNLTTKVNSVPHIIVAGYSPTTTTTNSASTEKSTLPPEKGILASLKEKISSGAASIKDFCVECAHKVGNATSAAKEGIASFFSSTGELFRSAVEFIAPVAGWIRNVAERVSSAFSSALESAKSFVASIVSRFESGSKLNETQNFILLDRDQASRSSSRERQITDFLNPISSGRSSFGPLPGERSIGFDKPLAEAIREYATLLNEVRRREAEKKEEQCSESKRHQAELKKEIDALLALHPELQGRASEIQRLYVHHIPTEALVEEGERIKARSRKGFG